MRRCTDIMLHPGSKVEATSDFILPSGPGPLFVNLDRGHVRRRLSGTGVYDLVREHGEAVGIRARPHGLRHAAITEALDRGTDVRAVRNRPTAGVLKAIVGARSSPACADLDLTSGRG